MCPGTANARRKSTSGSICREWINGETGGYLRVCTEGRNWFETDFPNWLKEPALDLKTYQRSEEHGSYIIEALETGRTYRGHFNVPNQGHITNLPEGCIVEIPGYVDKTGINMPVVGDLPLACAATCSASARVQEMGMEAAVHGDVTLLKQAMLHDPLTGAVCNPEEVWQMTDEMLVAQAGWLPNFAHEIGNAKGRLAQAERSGKRVRLVQTQGAARLHTKTVEEMAADKVAAAANAAAADKGKMTPRVMDDSAIVQVTPYPDINAILGMLLTGVREILGSCFIGLYLYGSLSSGDFDPKRSDIDFLVVTECELPDAMLHSLAAMHARIAASSSPWARRLEGSYIPQSALRRYDPHHAQHPSIGVDWSFGINGHGSDWIIQRHIIREQGAVLAGPPPQALIDPVSQDDLRRAIQETLQGWWADQLRNPVHLQTREYQAYAVLTMCRALYTLEEGAIVSKPVAARWAQQTLGNRWAGLIERALVWHEGDGIDDLQETLEFIRYTLERLITA